MNTFRLPVFGLLVLGIAAAALPAQAADDAHIAKAEKAIAKAVDYFKANQQTDGSWLKNQKLAIVKPAVTALVTAGLLRNGVKRDDPVIAKALTYLLQHQQEDGSFSMKGVMPNYTTALALMALGQCADDPTVAKTIAKAHDWARKSQWQDGKTDTMGNKVTKDNRFYGGFGYGKHGRPDMSNTTLMLEALHDSGFDCNDPVFKRAMVFITRCQGTESNKMLGDKIVPNGGHIYSTSINSKNLESYDTPRSNAGDAVTNNQIVVIDKSGRSMLQTYGSMTYAGFKSMLYAQLSADDPRVKDAVTWIKNYYTLDRNPNVGMQGYYYYLYVFSRAMHASGKSTVTVANGRDRNWSNELIDTLCDLQQEDGTWVNQASSRWMEDQKDLVTAFALLSLTFAKNAQ